MNITFACVAALMAALCLTACGGGDSGGGAPAGGGGGGGGNTLSFSGPTFTVAEETDLAGQLTASDTSGASVTFAKSSDPARGTLVSFNASGAFVYRPGANFAGSDTFTVTVGNGRGGSATGTVTVNVTNVNDSPVAQDDFLEITSSGLASIAVKANDIDVDSDALTVSIVETLPLGTTTINANGTVSVTGLPAGFAGTLGFKYRVTDPSGLSSTATAVLFVDVPGIRMVFFATSAQTGLQDIYLSDFASTRKITQSAAGDAAFDQQTLARDGSTIAFTRSGGGDTANRQATGRLFVQRTAAGSAPMEVQAPAGMEFAVPRFVVTPPPDLPIFVTLALSGDGRWLAFMARPAGGTNTSPWRLYMVDTQQTARPLVPVRVGNDAEHLYVWSPQFVRGTTDLVFVGSSSGATTSSPTAAYSVNAANLPALARISEPESTGTTIATIIQAVSGRRFLLSGTRAGIPRLAMIERANPGIETHLNPEFVAGDQLRGLAFSPDQDLSFVAFGRSVGGAGVIRRVSSNGAVPAVTCTLPGAPLPLAAVRSVTSDGSRLVTVRSPSGFIPTGSTTGYTLEMTDVASCGQTVIATDGPNNGLFTVRGDRIIGLPTTASGPALVYTVGNFASPQVMAPPGASSRTYLTYNSSAIGVAAGELYVTNFYAPDVWFSPTASLPDATNALFAGIVDSKP